MACLTVRYLYTINDMYDDIIVQCSYDMFGLYTWTCMIMAILQLVPLFRKNLYVMRLASNYWCTFVYMCVCSFFLINFLIMAWLFDSSFLLGSINSISQCSHVFTKNSLYMHCSLCHRTLNFFGWYIREEKMLIVRRSIV